MRKSVWLLSAGFFALATPGFAQDNTTPTEEAGEVNPNADVSPTDEVGTTSESDIIITAQGRQQILQDVPIAVTQSMPSRFRTEARPTFAN